MNAEEVDKIEAAFKAKNSGASELPIYIPKTRFDEVSAKKQEAEKTIEGFEAAKSKAVEDALSKYKDVPNDWKEQIQKLQNDITAQKTEYEGKLVAAAKSAEVSEKLYGAGVRNVKAVKALIDDTKPIDDEIARIKTSDPYLFKGGSYKGTGKGEGDDGEGKGKDNNLSTAKMYAAVGITPPAE